MDEVPQAMKDSPTPFDGTWLIYGGFEAMLDETG